MQYMDNKVSDLQIAYIGGGSKGWAWGLMSDLAREESLSGTVRLYDIDDEAAKANEIIGNKVTEANPDCSKWSYSKKDSLEVALTGADFVILSILPGTFDHMEVDVHHAEKYGIYQSVGDTVGPGGLMRALRTIPMYVVIANAIKDYAPEAWVLNYTNPMTICTRTLYKVFPKIKAFGNCHEVFGTQKVLSEALSDIKGISDVPREEIKVNALGVNHFTWITEASYKGMDLMPIYDEFVEKYHETGYEKGNTGNWMNDFFASTNRVKFDLYRRFGAIAAAGDRHLAEFCPGSWYLDTPEMAKEWRFGLTPVSWRKNNEQERKEKSQKLLSGEETFELKETGEEGIRQIKALLGLEDLVTNVNIPNRGQIPELPMDCVVETNALIRKNSVTPLVAGQLPPAIMALTQTHVSNQEMIVEAGLTGNLDLAFNAFVKDPLVRMTLSEAKECFDDMFSLSGSIKE